MKSAVKPSKRSRVLVRKETTAAYLFLLPSLIFFLGFVIYPIVLCVWTSFFDSTMNAKDVFVGFANYKELFQDKVFLGALKNTFIIVVVSVPITGAFSLWVSSIIVDLKGWATSLFRIIFYLPVVTGSVAVTVVWKWMFNNYYGIFNYLGTTTGLIEKNINWLGDERYALACIIIILLTTSVGQPIVLYVSALGNVDASLVEAANVDGATRFQAFWKVKWPQIMPTTLYILVITTINSFQCFALIQLLTSGGPNHSTDTIMYYIYYSAFKLYRYGYGDAMGVVLAIMIAILSAIQFKLGNSNDLFTFPLYWIITGSFKTNAAINSTTPIWWPQEWTLANYQKLFSRQTAPLFQFTIPFSSLFTGSSDLKLIVSGPSVPAAIRWLINTVVMAVLSMILTCITASMAGYALAKKRFVGRQFLFTMIVCAMALPNQVILVPLLREMSNLDLYNTIWAVVFPIVGWPFGVFLMKQFSEGVPSEMIEAASIDGASEAKTFVRIIVPMIKPGIGALAIFTFINSWNDYFMQLIMLSSTSNLTISLGIAKLQAENATDFGLIMAGAALAAVPIIIVFLIFQKYFTKGIAMGAVKG